MSSDTHYDVLGIHHSASIDEIRKAYRAKLLATHPDKLDKRATEEDKQRAENKFRKIRDAFDVLGDPLKRREYDTQLNSRQSGPTKWPEELIKKTRDRQEWARKQEQKHQEQMGSLLNQHDAVYKMQKNRKPLTKEVQEIVDAINLAIDEARPGWLERLRKAQQMTTDWESRPARQQV